MSSNTLVGLSLLLASQIFVLSLPGSERPAFEILHAFSPNTPTENPARNPFGGLVLAGDGNLYGTTIEGGGFHDGGQSFRGTLFRLTPAGEVTTLNRFAHVNWPMGGGPVGPLSAAVDGTLYGVTSFGGDVPANASFGGGTLFSLTVPGAVFQQVTTFYSGASATIGASRYGLVRGDDGRFYGVGSGGPLAEILPNRASLSSGSIYAVTTNGVFSVLRTFAGGGSVPPVVPDGTYPKGLLAKGPGGNFYGVTSFDGLEGHGTCYRIHGSGEFTTLATFNGTNGSRPEAGLIWGTDGNLYGVTSGGGTVTNAAGTGFGTVFRLSPSGDLVTLHSFDYVNDGSLPQSELLERNGAFYGSTRGGSTSTIYRVGADGTFAKLAEFPSAGGVDDNVSKLVVGGDGNLYGTVAVGGPLGGGFIFRVNLPAAPVIVGHPTSQTVALGSPVTFSVTATGALPFSYQWLREGAELPGRTNASLTLDRTEASDVGNFAVRVTNSGGNVTSRNAVLSFLDIEIYPGLTINGPVGARYRIDQAPEANSTAWLPLTEVTLSTSPYTFGDLTAPARIRRFYRAVLLQ